MISVVLPVYRNEDTVEELTDRLERALDGRELELLFVVDGSPDGSLAVLERLAASHEAVRVLALERNRGQARAIMRGVAAARGEEVVVMDADLQDPPEAVPSLLAGLDRAAAVFAGRRGAYESRGRLATGRLFRRLNHLLCGVPRDAGAFVALRADAVEAVLALNGPPPAPVSMIGLTGLPTASIPVERARRRSGTSSHGSGARIRAGLRGLGWGVLWRFRPLRVVGSRLAR